LLQDNFAKCQVQIIAFCVHHPFNISWPEKHTYSFVISDILPLNPTFHVYDINHPYMRIDKEFFARGLGDEISRGIL
jgi:hypothetical protein